MNEASERIFLLLSWSIEDAPSWKFMCAAPRVRFSIANKNENSHLRIEPSQPASERMSESTPDENSISFALFVKVENEDEGTKTACTEDDDDTGKNAPKQNRDRTFSKTYDSIRMPKLDNKHSSDCITFKQFFSLVIFLLHFVFFFLFLTENWCSFNAIACVQFKMQFCVFMGAEIETKKLKWAVMHGITTQYVSVRFLRRDILVNWCCWCSFFSLFFACLCKHVQQSNVKSVDWLHCLSGRDPSLCVNCVQKKMQAFCINFKNRWSCEFFFVFSFTCRLFCVTMILFLCTE